MKRIACMTAVVALVAAAPIPAAAHGPGGTGERGYGEGYDHHDDMMEMMHGFAGPRGYGGMGPGMMGQGMMGPGMMGPGMMGPGMMGQGMMGGPGMMPWGGMMGHLGMSGGLFAEADANGDGIVSPEEASAAHAAQLEAFDTNGDGMLGIDEFEALHAAAIRELMVDRFQYLDADGDGQITPEEMNAPIDRMLRFMRMQEQFGPALDRTEGGYGTRPRRRGDDDLMPHRGPDADDMPGRGGGMMRN